MGVDHHCLFLSGAEYVVLLELILHGAIEMASVEFLVKVTDVVDIVVIICRKK